MEDPLRHVEHRRAGIGGGGLRSPGAGGLRPIAAALLVLLAQPMAARATEVGDRPSAWLTFGIFLGAPEEGARVLSPVRLMPFEHPDSLGHEFPNPPRFHRAEIEILIRLGQIAGLGLQATLSRYPAAPAQDWPYAEFRQPPSELVAGADVLEVSRSPIPGLRAVAFVEGMPLAFLVDTRGLSLSERGMVRPTTMGLDLTRRAFLRGLAEVGSLLPHGPTGIVRIRPSGPEPPLDALARRLDSAGRAPADYVLSKFVDHRVVIFGEPHRMRHDVRLVLDLVPRLRDAGVGVLACELFPAGMQPEIDRLLRAERWDRRDAMALMRAAAWPYEEYLEILHAIWTANHSGEGARAPLTVIGLEPGRDWRERLLPAGQSYDGFMAERVLRAVREHGTRALVYVGAHHGFTRYEQPEMPRQQRVERFIDRMGNAVRRELGEDVFLALAHWPWPCRRDGTWSRCLPVAGTIDCAAGRLDRPVGFDVAGSLFGQLPIDAGVYYGMGYRDLRLGELTDGYVWPGPIDAYRAVTLIPLAEFAPDEDALREVAEANPFSDEDGLGPTELESLWERERAALAALARSQGWEHLLSWRESCGRPGRPSPGEPGG